MRIENLISENVKQKLGYKSKSTKDKQNKRNKEKLSVYDIKELMGVNRKTYKRVRGSLRQR